MFIKGMLKNVDGLLMKKEDFCIIYKLVLIINGFYVYNFDLLEEVKVVIVKVFFDVLVKDKVVFDCL